MFMKKYITDIKDNLLFEEVNAEAGISKIVCASTEEELIKQKQETITDKKTYIETIPFLDRIGE